jgi:hypothetical protein
MNSDQKPADNFFLSTTLKKSTAMRERFQISVHYNGLYTENVPCIRGIWMNLGINVMQLIWLKKEEHTFGNRIGMIIQNHNPLPFMDIEDLRIDANDNIL